MACLCNGSENVDLLAPVLGKVMALTDVPDPVFAGGMLGQGCCVLPGDDVVCAPVAGVVTAAMPHALGISGSGVEVLVHVGIDTVEMHGDGFELLVCQGESVEAGQPLVRFDRERVAAAGHPDCVVVVVTNSADVACVEMLAAPDASVSAGDPLVRVTL